MAVTVANLKAAQTFYIEALGFHMTAVETIAGEAFAALTGLAAPRARLAVMQLGAQILELTEFADPGRPYPEPRAANDPWFQHFAIAVSDMDQAFAELSRFGAEPISHGGPQRLPPSTGDVTAYKFRDPDGHPLELSHAPQNHWATDAASTGPATLGLDHSALAVADLDASLRFYTEGLGLRLGPRALNQGPEQARLDGLDDPKVDILTLTTADSGPHLELLHYRQPRSAAPPLWPGMNDIAAARLVMRTQALDQVVERAIAAGGARISTRIVETASGRRVLLRDPDGHILDLISPID